MHTMKDLRWSDIERKRPNIVNIVCILYVLYYILPYLIFVIFFTRARFLENKIYTEKRKFFALNL